MKRIKKVFGFLAERPLLAVILGFFIFFLALFLYAMIDPSTEDTDLANAEFEVIKNSKFPTMDYFTDRQEYPAMEESKKDDSENDELRRKLKEMEDKYRNLYERNLKNLYAEQLNQNEGSFIDKDKNVRGADGEIIAPRELLERQAREITTIHEDGLKENDGSYIDKEGNLRNKNGGMIANRKSIEDLGKEVVRVQDGILANDQYARLNEDGDIVDSNGDIIASKAQIKNKAQRIRDLYNDILKENPNYFIDKDGNVRNENGDIVYTRKQIENLADLGAKLRNGMLYDRDGNLINKDGIIITPARKEVKPRQKEIYVYPQAPSKGKAPKRRNRRTITPEQMRALQEMGGSRVVIGGQVAKNAEVGVYDFGVGGFSNFNDKDVASNEHRLYRTITANKNIPAVLNTPISSQIAGKITATVLKDVYANMGRAVLIPKGSYVIGYFRNNNKIGEYRLDVVWTRIITPQGVNLILTKEARGSDVKGYSGLVGEVIEKNWEKYGVPLLVSTLANTAIMGGAGALSNLATTNKNPYGAYILGDISKSIQNDVSAVVKQYLEDHTNVKPIIIIREGSRIFISPNVDIFVPYPKKKEVILEFFNPSPKSQYDPKEKILAPDNRGIDNHIEYPMEGANNQ